MTRAGLLAATLVALACAYGWGRYDGGRMAHAAHAQAAQAAMAQTMRAAELASRKEAERLALEAELTALAQTLEDEAHADPVRVPECLSVDRVRRLNRLR